MLAKLLKYEFKATGRKFIPLYMAIVIVSIITRITMPIPALEKVPVLGIIILVGLFVATAVLNLTVCIERFNKNLLGDEGYLMFTLPVKSGELIMSKLIVSVVWAFLAGVIAILAFMIMATNSITIKEIAEAFAALKSELPRLISMITLKNWEIVSLVILIPVGMVINYTLPLLCIYASLSFAQVGRFNKHRIPVAFIIFFIISWIITFLSTTVFKFVLEKFMYVSNIAGIAGVVIWSGILAVSLFYLTKYLLKNHLNLE